jgi:hypothetical protein
MSVFDYFIGAQQSKYASVAIIVTILFICVGILFANSDVPFANRLGIVAFVILISIFPVALSLFELTCIVTGGKGQSVNLCNYYAWFITIIVIVYCFMLILVVVSSMFTYRKAGDKITMTEAFDKMSPDEANQIAQDMLNGEPNDKKKAERATFENAPANASSAGSLLPVMAPAAPAAPAAKPVVTPVASAAPAAPAVPTPQPAAVTPGAPAVPNGAPGATGAPSAVPATSFTETFMPF